MAPLVLGLAIACAAAGLLALGPLAPMPRIAVAIARVEPPRPPAPIAAPPLGVAPKTSPPVA